MMSRWRRFRRLSAFEQLVVLEAVAALPIAWVVLRVFGFGLFKPSLANASGKVTINPQPALSTALELSRRIAHLEAAVAASLPLGTTCLEQSVVLCWVLRRRGMNPELRVGGRKTANRFEAHAWVELNGNILNGGETERALFVPFTHFDPTMEAQTH